MGLLDGFAFWKKKEAVPGNLNDIPIPPLQGPGDDFGGLTPGQGMQQSFQPQPSPMQQSFHPQMDSLQSVQGYTASKDMEVISAKLDAIRAALENISQRLANLERSVYGEQQQQPQYQYRRGW